MVRLVYVAVIFVLSLLAIQQTFASNPGPREITNFAWSNFKQSVDIVDKFVKDKLSYSNPSVEDSPAPDNWQSLKIKPERAWQRFADLMEKLFKLPKNQI